MSSVTHLPSTRTTAETRSAALALSSQTSVEPDVPKPGHIESSGWLFDHDKTAGPGLTRVTGLSMPNPGLCLVVQHTVKVDLTDRLVVQLHAEYGRSDPVSLTFLRLAFPPEAGFKVKVAMGKGLHGALGENAQTIRVMFPEVRTPVKYESFVDDEKSFSIREDAFARRVVRDELVRDFLSKSLVHASNEMAIAHLSKSLPSEAVTALRASMPVNKSPEEKFKCFADQLLCMAKVDSQLNGAPKKARQTHGPLALGGSTGRRPVPLPA